MQKGIIVMLFIAVMYLLYRDRCKTSRLEHMSGTLDSNAEALAMVASLYNKERWW